MVKSNSVNSSPENDADFAGNDDAFNQILRDSLVSNFNVKVRSKIRSLPYLSLVSIINPILGETIACLWKNGTFESKSVAARKSLYQLMQNVEFVYSVFFEKLGIFPRIFGTCGSIYVTEKVSRKLIMECA